MSGLRSRLVVLGLVACFCRSAVAQEMDVPVDVQVPLLYKILSFDRNLGERAAGDDIVIAIIYQEAYRASVNVRNEVKKAALRIGETKILGHLVNWVWLELAEVPDLESAFLKYGVDVLYVTPLRGVGLDRITAATRGKRVTSFTGVPEFVNRGLAVGIALQKERPLIVINLAAARAEGAEFGSQLLNLARVVKSEE
jgi:hypothetical protein